MFSEVGVFVWRIVNLERLILISNLGTFKIQMLDPSLYSYTCRYGYRKVNKLISSTCRVGTNMGYRKVDKLISRSLMHKIEINAWSWDLQLKSSDFGSYVKVGFFMSSFKPFIWNCWVSQHYTRPGRSSRHFVCHSILSTFLKQ